MAENQNIEYKSSWRDEYLKWVCGFANAGGGTIYIDLDDAGEIVGLSDEHRLLEDIPNKIVSTLGIAPAVRLQEDRRGNYIEIEVEPQSFPVSYKGQYYMRVGATNQLLKGVALDTFLLRKQGQSWDNAPVPGLSLGELSRDAMSWFLERARGKGRVPEEAQLESPEELVKHLRLERDGYLTNAAALLFCPEPDAYVPGSIVKVGFFEGPEVIYQDEVTGPIIQQVDKTVDLLYGKYLKAKISYEGIRRVERYPFPEAAVREAVVNAIAHKNYASGAPIQIRVYDDKVSIADTCVLPQGWGVEDLLGPHVSEPHNPKVANAFFLAGFVESWGRGVQKIFTECKLDGIYPPTYTMAGSSLIVELTAPEERVVRTGGRVVGTSAAKEGSDSIGSNGETQSNAAKPGQLPPVLAELGGTWRNLAELWDDLSKPEKLVLEYIAENGVVQPKELDAAIDFPVRTLQRASAHLIELGLIEASGKSNARRYSIKKTDTKED
jgi:ATP-dependent DNA helicase RecG